MSVLWTNAACIDAFELRCGIRWKSDARGRDRISGGRHAGRLRQCVIGAPGKHVHDLDPNGGFRAGVDACGLKAVAQAAVTHIAFAHYASLLVELRNGVGAVPHTVLAADARI